MKRNLLYRNDEKRNPCTKRIGMLLLFSLFFMIIPVSSIAQEQKLIHLTMGNATIQEVISKITAITDYDFVYKVDDLSSVPVRDYDFQMASIKQVLNRLLENTDLKWTENDGVISISTRIDRQQTQMRKLSGIITDAKTGKPIEGASVIVVGTKRGAITDADGKYTLDIQEKSPTIEVIYIGYKTQRITVGNRTTLNIALEEDTLEIETIVVDGLTTRIAESYTGAITIFSREDLMRSSTANIFQSLKHLDASLYFPVDFAMGSDPNTIPNMVMRGGTSFFNDSSELISSYQDSPNMPLFVVDGFVVSSEKIKDMDMNLIQNIVLLKDAAAKALYGAKAANGVLVITTVPISVNKPLIQYSGTLDLQMPDLSSYNLTNALEKLEVEYREIYSNYLNVDGLTKFYDTRKQALEGLDTDWISKPVRFGYGQKHSLIFTVGTAEGIKIRANVKYQNIVGVMKGSDRTVVGTNLRVDYTYRKLRVQNSIDVTNGQYTDSPYGDFIYYTLLNPYISLYDESGQVRKIVGSSRNYYYDGLINTQFKREYNTVTNNLNISWNPLNSFWIQGSFSFTIDRRQYTDYYPHNHTTQLYIKDIDSQGKIDLEIGRSNNLAGNLSAVWTNVFGNHSLIINAVMDLSEYKDKTTELTAVGLPSDNMDDMLYALKYADNNRPEGSASLQREVGATGIISYAYKNRYSTDLTLRTNATSVFGVKNRWAPFWSLGVMWNIHNEDFLAENENIKTLAVRASVGTTGSQDFRSNKSLAVYTYELAKRYNGKVGAWASNMENPELKWMRKLEYNVELKANLYGIDMRVEGYLADTKDAVTQLSTAPSTGYSSVSDNIGEMRTKGMEFSLNYKPFIRERSYISLHCQAVMERTWVTKISDAMRSYNEAIIEAYNDVNNLSKTSASTMPALLWYDGVDPNAIWVVPSAGIDPATGHEVYIDKEGNYTFIYNGSYLQPVGSKAPKIRGIFGISGEYKGFGLNIACTFEAGGQFYNSTLQNKIENISIYDNFDKRVLTERWQRVDQDAYFITLSGKRAYRLDSGLYWYEEDGSSQQSAVRASSRFVQDRNEFIISSVSIYYDFPARILQAIKIQRLKISAYMENIATFSTIGIERGTTYPFSRTLTFALSMSF